MVVKVINGKEIAEKIIKKTTVEVKVLTKKYKIKPNIKTIKIGKDKASDLYLLS